MIDKDTHYESLEDLRKAVEKAYGAVLSESEWQHVKPGWETPFGKEDANDILGRLKRPPPKKQHTAKKTSDWDADIISGLNTALIERLRELDLRSKLKTVGLTLPVPPTELKDVLLEIGATEKPPDGQCIPFPYVKSLEMFPTSPGDRQKAMFPTGNLDTLPMEIEVLYAKRDTLAEHIAASAHTLAALSGYRYHPAEIITLWFCDIDFFPWDNNLKMFRWGRTIEIRVNWVGVKPSSVAKAYSFARNSIVKEIRGRDTGKRVKPKKLSDRTQTLVEFCEEMQNLKWEEKLREWNRIFPAWTCKDAHLMTVVYSRAKRRKI